MLLLIISSAQAHADSSYPKSSDGVVQIKAGNALFGSGGPSTLLSRELKQNQDSKQFRVNWYFGAGGASGGYTALYKRDESTLKLYGEYETESNTLVQQYFFIHVTDDTIHQLAEKYKLGEDKEGSNFDDMAYFRRVTEFGAQSQELPTKPKSKSKS
jgi:hypothetical protein